MVYAGVPKTHPLSMIKKQNGPEVAEDGKVFQVIPNTLLDYGKSYKVRAFLTTSTGTY